MRIRDIFDIIKTNKFSAFFYTPVIYKDAISYLFKIPELTLSAYNLNELNELFDTVENYKDKGFTGYGYVKYETAYLFEDKLMQCMSSNKNQPLSRFCMFDESNVVRIKSKDIDFSEAEQIITGRNHRIDNFRLNKDKESFNKDFQKIKQYIKRGDTYQVNYTVKSAFDLEGDINSLFMKLIFAQSSEYTAFINDETDLILSSSPELFFEINRNSIRCKPMKGTSKRGFNTEIDNDKRLELEESRKNRSENVMIVDMLRNDLSKIADKGTVKVNNLFETEKYETLYQMTSTINATLPDNIKLKDIFESIFPCGSITGAPKLRTMEIIDEIEKEERGIYTGALGIVDNDKAIFNVPIRTLVIKKATGKGEMGIGSGIVWESEAEEEYKETVLKSSFLTNPADYFYLFETMLLENGSIFLLDEHLARLKAAADFFLFYYDENKIKKVVGAILKNELLTKNLRLKLKLVKWGNVSCETAIVKDTEQNVKIKISDITVESRNKFQYFKTSKREMYDREYSKCIKEGFFDVVFFNEKGELTEGSITNIFIRKKGKLLTPKVSCGLLNGIYRNYFISKHPDCEETIIYKDDLLNADEIILTNSVRKEVKVQQL